MRLKTSPTKKFFFALVRGRIFLYPLFFVCLLLMVFYFRGSVKYVYSVQSDTVTGYAWSSNIGWIKMNCYQKGAPACSGQGGRDYGVNIDSITKNFSGYAWSSNAGWIAFQGNNPPNYNFNWHCPSPCNAGANCTACIDGDTLKIYGWAQILALGNRGWINMSSTSVDSLGVRVDQSSASGSWLGWGWNKNDDGSGIGWVSFNCANTGSCGLADYKTYLNFTLPLPINLSAPNWPFASACGASGARNASLHWQLAGTPNPQAHLRVIINTSNTTSSPLYDSGKIAGINGSHSAGSAVLTGYDQPYYWWVKVWDSFGFASRWVQFDTGVSGHTLTDNIVRNGQIGGPKTFTTYKHEFPKVVYSWLPRVPLVDEVATFTEASLIYHSGSGQACTKTTCAWNWSAPNARTNTSPAASSTTMTFPFGFSQVTETVTDTSDADSYACASTSQIFTDLLPKWREIKAQ